MLMNKDEANCILIALVNRAWATSEAGRREIEADWLTPRELEAIRLLHPELHRALSQCTDLHFVRNNDGSAWDIEGVYDMNHALQARAELN